jgi:hypothetical protein
VIEYPKIETLFNRDATRHKVVIGAFRHPAFAIIDRWLVTEKVDGTNIRVHLSEDNVVTIGGRTDNAQLPAKLVAYLHETFPADRIAAVRKEGEPVALTLFGEGYGAGIQRGGGYCAEQRFILFDVLVADRWWLDEEAVSGIAQRLGIERVPLNVETMTVGDIVAFVMANPPSNVGLKQCQSEGIVARTTIPLFDNVGKRIMFKLKHRDF